ncbi:hypothetical protein LEWO105114_00435 [Legionella worsleiensis]|uniref:Uncharacterized protein n=1 Tax=Legionella worsleiensis TaxID=45076 RepID=A0A0W1AEF6_9GAMM|nr:hypothetical protein Lwor_1239 [Legionella worsleiensis]STY32236.1 Uncharacterised protein [Legionella worsleiensis]
MLESSATAGRSLAALGMMRGVTYFRFTTTEEYKSQNSNILIKTPRVYIRHLSQSLVIALITNLLVFCAAKVSIQKKHPVYFNRRKIRI